MKQKYNIGDRVYMISDRGITLIDIIGIRARNGEVYYEWLGYNVNQISQNHCYANKQELYDYITSLP